MILPLRKLIIGFAFVGSLRAQHSLLLRPIDAVHLAEISDLFAYRYAQHGCPRAKAAIGSVENEIQLRVEDGCSGGVSSWVGDYRVNRSTGEVRSADVDDPKIIIKKGDPSLVAFWVEIESLLLNEREASCLISETPDIQEWKRLGISFAERIVADKGFFSVTITPSAATPPAPDRVLRMSVDRAEYRIYGRRFSEEYLGRSVLGIRQLLLAAKQSPSLSRLDVLEGVRLIPEIASWLKADGCRGIRLEEDQEGATYYSVDLYRWCDGQPRATSLGGFDVDKRTGDIRGVQAIPIVTPRLPNAVARLQALAETKSLALDRLKATCLASSK